MSTDEAKLPTSSAATKPIMVNALKLVIFNAKRRLLRLIGEIDTLIKASNNDMNTRLERAKTLQLQSTRTILLLNEQNDKWLTYIQTTEDAEREEAERYYDEYTKDEDNFVATTDLGRASLDLVEAFIMLNTKNDPNDASNNFAF